MGSCFSKKPKNSFKEEKSSTIFERKVSKSCTPEPNVCSSIELIFENQSIQQSSKSPSIILKTIPKSGSAKSIINDLHRNKKPREDLNEVQKEIKKATQFVENQLSTSKSLKKHESVLMKRLQSGKVRSKSKPN